MRKILLLSILIVSLLDSKAQLIDSSKSPDKFSFGIGMGFDYGGFGGNLTYYPNTNFGLFAGAGYAMDGLGYNAGLKIRFNAKEANRIKPYITAMYGYNAVIVVKNQTNLNKIFYGPTLGFGVDFRQRPGRIGYWTIGLLIPVRFSNVENYMDDLEDNHNVEFKDDLPTIGFTFGYKFVLEN